MSNAFVVGHILIKKSAKWAEYRDQVPATLAPWGAELVFRGTQVAAYAGESPYTDIVVIRFPSVTAANNWFASEAYQALIPLRKQAAEVTLITYEA